MPGLWNMIFLRCPSEFGTEFAVGENGRAKWGGSGALNLQTALAGPNSSTEVFSLLASSRIRGIEGRVPCDGVM